MTTRGAARRRTHLLVELLPSSSSDSPAHRLSIGPPSRPRRRRWWWARGATPIAVPPPPPLLRRRFVLPAVALAVSLVVAAPYLVLWSRGGPRAHVHVHAATGVDDGVVGPSEYTYRYAQSSLSRTGRVWNRTRQTLTSHVVAGVNLASYGGMGIRMGGAGRDAADAMIGAAPMPNANGGDEPGDEHSPPFELFEDFDVGPNVTGDEGWWDLQRYKRLAGERHPSLTFYVDKVAQKRWLPEIRYDVPRSFGLRHRTEVEAGLGAGAEATAGGLARAVGTLLPAGASFVAKASHLSEARGVWIVDCCRRDRRGRLVALANRGVGCRALDRLVYPAESGVDYRDGIARALADDLGRMDETEEAAQLRLTPGIVVEERFGSPDGTDNNLPAIEFKCFVIWGRFWMGHYRRGDMERGYWHRNGTLVRGTASNMHVHVLPEYVDWDLVVDIAERRAAHKDFFRVDIYVGVARSDALGGRHGRGGRRPRPRVRHVVSETEMETTSKFRDRDLHDEGARLWIAGYKMGNYRIVENTEVPRVYLENGLRLPKRWRDLESPKDYSPNNATK